MSVCLFNLDPCPEGWDDSGDHCYKVMTEPLTFTEASAKCELFNAQLSSIHSAAEQAYHTGKVSESHPGTKKFRNFGLFAGNPAVFSVGFPLILYFKAGNPANH